MSVFRVKYGPFSKKGGWPPLNDRNFGMLVYITFLYISKTMYANFGPFLFVCTYGHWLAPKKGGWPPLNDRKFGLLIDIPFLHISKTEYKFWAISVMSVLRVKYGPISKKGGWPPLNDRNFGMLVYITFVYLSKTMYVNFGPFLFMCTYGHW